MDSPSKRKYKRLLNKISLPPFSTTKWRKGQILVEFIYFALALVGVFFFVLLMGQKTLKTISTFQF